MKYSPGKSGNPGGRPRDKAFADAVRIAVNREDKDGRKKLNQLAEKLIEFALAGEGWAMQQIADRLDGKPAQESTVTIDDKRDATDWSRAELVSFLNDARDSSGRAVKTNGRDAEANRVH